MVGLRGVVLGLVWRAHLHHAAILTANKEVKITLEGEKKQH